LTHKHERIKSAIYGKNAWMRQRKQNQTVSSQSRSQKPSCVRTSILAIEPAIRWDGSHSVTDLETARTRLLQRGVEVGEIRHKTPLVPGMEVSHPGSTPRGDSERSRLDDYQDLELNH